MNSQTYDAIVIGAGAAGLSAAQALGRSRRRTLVLDAGERRNRFAAHMHNVLGHDGLSPDELTDRGFAELAGYGVEVRQAQVREVREVREVVPGEGRGVEAGKQPHDVAPVGHHDDLCLVVELASGETLLTRAVVLATGVVDRVPEVPGLAERWGASVLHCPYCHGWEVRDQRLAVLTTSPMGMHQAKLLRQWSDNLTVFAAGLGEVSEADLRDLTARNITVIDAAVAELTGKPDEPIGVRTSDGAVHEVDAIFTMSSMEPRDEAVRGLELDRADQMLGNFIVVDAMQRTSHERIWAAGNVVMPTAAVPQSMGGGVLAGAAANMALVEADFALAVKAQR